MAYTVRSNVMRALVHQVYGGPEVLSVSREVPVPDPGAGEVLVRVACAAVDRGTVHLLTGLPLLARPFIGLRRPRSGVPGRDVVGVVEAAGAGVTSVAVGDLVAGTTSTGSLAEFAVVPERRLAVVPPGVEPERAAALPVSGTTALQALREAGRLRSGQSVLVVGASGGVGTFAVQLARVLGASQVGAVCSAAKAGRVRSLGADPVLDHAREEVGDDGRRYDLVVDIGGNRPLSVLRRAMAPTGTLVIVGGEGGGRVLGGVQRQLGAVLRSSLVKQRFAAPIARENGDDVAELLRLVAAGELAPVIDRVVPLAEAPQALGDLVAGRVTGKVVVRVAAG